MDLQAAVRQPAKLVEQQAARALTSRRLRQRQARGVNGDKQRGEPLFSMRCQSAALRLVSFEIGAVEKAEHGSRRP